MDFCIAFLQIISQKYEINAMNTNKSKRRSISLQNEFVLNVILKERKNTSLIQRLLSRSSKN